MDMDTDNLHACIYCNGDCDCGWKDECAGCYACNVESNTYDDEYDSNDDEDWIGPFGEDGEW